MNPLDIKDTKKTINNILQSPVIKAAAIGAVILILIFISGKIMAILASVVVEYKGLHAALMA